MYDSKLLAPGWKAQGACILVGAPRIQLADGFYFALFPLFYSYYKPIIFNQVLIALDDGECVSVSNLYPGSTHDGAIYMDSEACKLLQQSSKYAIGDSAYENCPYVVAAAPTGHVPIADPKDSELRIAQDLHSHRVVVEHFNASIHKWQILDQRIFRGDPKSFALYFFVCAQLTELKRRFPVYCCDQ